MLDGDDRSTSLMLAGARRSLGKNVCAGDFVVLFHFRAHRPGQSRECFLRCSAAVARTAGLSAVLARFVRLWDF